MARTKNTQQTAEDFDFGSIQLVQTEELPTAVRSIAPNPLEGHVKDNVDGEPQAFRVPNGERAEEAHSYLRRAANQLKVGLKVRYTGEDDQPMTPKAAWESTEAVWVYFVATSDRVEREYTARRYTAQEIREHFGLGEKDKITSEQRAEFRKVKGYDKPAEQE